MPSAHYKYTDKLGATAFYIVRWDFIKDNQRKKETRPYTFNVQKNEWCSNNSYPTPHPLYNLLELISRPDSPVLIVEGEKTVEAAKQLFPDYVVVTSCKYLDNSSIPLIYLVGATGKPHPSTSSLINFP